MGVETIQTNFTSGVLDELLEAREDLTYYFNGLGGALNLLVLPQGGVTARPGLRHVRELSPVLSAISLAGATITAPKGGTANNLKDGDTTTYVITTSDLSTTNPFVIAHIDLGAATAVTAVDVINLKLNSLSLSGEIFVQYSTDDITFTSYGGAIDIDTTDRSRRRRAEAGPVTARYWRLARIGATSVAARPRVAEMKFWANSATLSNGRFVPFAKSTTEAYMQVISDRNIDTLIGDQYVGSIYTPHTTTQVPVVNSAQQLDTLLLYHKDVRTQKIFRQGGDDEFDFRDLTRTNIPKYEYGAGTGGANAVQRLSDTGTASGDKMTLELEGQVTTQIAVGASRAATATNIETALNALQNTGSGITVADATTGFDVTFAGVCGKRPWLNINVFVMSGNGVWDTATTTTGEPTGEDIMSDTRGWPRCGVFYQSRLHEGGITSLPNAWLASVVASYYNFDTSIENDTKAILFRADTDQVSAIYQIYAGRDLTFFTNDTEFYNTVEPVSEKSVMKLATRSGSKEGLRVHEADGALLFIQGVRDKDSSLEIGTCVREFIFDITVENYQANLLSKLSASLIKNPVDDALRKALSTGEADILLMVNDDGTGTAYTVLRTQDVNAFMPLSTRDGDSFKNVGVDKKRNVYFITERIINGTARRFVEIWDEDLLLDGGGIATMTAESFTATDGQDDFIYTFTNPAAGAAAIGVRINGGRLTSSQYSVNTGTKTVTLSAEIAADIVAGDIVRIASMVKEITGLDHLKGETIQTVIDGTQGDDFTVSVGGVLTLSDYADTEIQYGFYFEVSGAMLPFRVAGQNTLAGKKIKNISCVLSLYQTGGIQIKVNGRSSWQEVELQQMDSNVLDRSTEELLFTGEKRVQGLLGCAVGAPFEFRRGGPCKFTLRAITREVVQ